MIPDKLDDILEDIPLEIRAEVREFANMPADAQRIHLYVTVRAMNQPTHFKTHLAQGVYTTVIALSVFARGMV